jgi:hypothetical protein
LKPPVAHPCTPHARISELPPPTVSSTTPAHLSVNIQCVKKMIYSPNKMNSQKYENEPVKQKEVNFY